MSNCWHADQENNMKPDVKARACPWCGLDSVVVDTIKTEGVYSAFVWSALASCHECGTKAPDAFITSFPDHPLYEAYNSVNWEDEREVVNFAMKIWNYRTSSTLM